MSIPRQMTSREEPDYFVPTTSKTLDILETFRVPGQELTLEEIVQSAKVARTTAFRILWTLERRRYVTRRGKHYRVNPVRKKIKVGFGSLTNELPFACMVTSSLSSAAAPAGIDLLVYDNHRDPQAAVENAKRMVAARVDVAIEFQRHAEVAPIIADIFAAAGIPLIAVHIPHPGAIYFGVDSYQSGFSAGAFLADFAQRRFNGQIDVLILLDIPEGGVVLQSRMTGVLQGIESICGVQLPDRVARVAGGGERNVARAATARVLENRSEARRVLVAACSDEGALGALDALTDLHLTGSAGIVGMEGSAEAIAEISKEKSCFIGTVAYHPEKYGSALVELVIRLINGEQIPPFWYVDHDLIDHAKASRVSLSRTGEEATA